jgi:hypothetical protein
VVRTTFRTTRVVLLVPLEEAWVPYREVVTLAEARAMIDAGTLHGARLGDSYLVSVAALADRFLKAAVKRWSVPPG